METIFAVAGVLCILYFITIVLYSGLSTSFCGVWLFFAAVFALMLFFRLRTKHREGGLPGRFPIAVFTSFFSAVLLFLALMFPVLRYAETPAEPGCAYVVVLGARVYPDRLSTTLLSRLERAYAYYEENPETVLILSGGQGRDEPVPEAYAMFNYLYRRGVPAQNLRMEIFSRNTEENIRFSREQILADAQRSVYAFFPEQMKTGIITNDFHMFRAIGIAEQEGYRQVYPISAPSDRILFLHLCVRESAALLKDHMMGHLSLFPRVAEP